jgi:hypothetical protein
VCVCFCRDVCVLFSVPYFLPSDGVFFFNLGQCKAEIPYRGGRKRDADGRVLTAGRRVDG